jgi:hypothetical protein
VQGRADRRAAEADRSAPPAADEGGPKLLVEDHGKSVRLRIDQRVSWDVAMKILAALKLGSAADKG